MGKFIPDFFGVVNRLVSHKTVEWIDPVSKKLMSGVVKEMEYICLEGAEDGHLHKPTNPYRLDVLGSDGSNYTLPVESVLFVK